MLKLPPLPGSSMSAMVSPESGLVTADCTCYPGEIYADGVGTPEFYDTFAEVKAAMARPKAGRYWAVHFKGKHVLNILAPGKGFHI